MTETHYDYIIAGAGCGGLSLAIRIVQSLELGAGKILIIDYDTKTKNDRSWCFWEQQPGIFEPIVYKEWKQLKFKNHDFHKELQINPYVYKMVRGIDFYRYCFNILNASPNVTILNGHIDEIFTSDPAGVIVDAKRYTAQFVFSSLYTKPTMGPKEYWNLQHFKGWLIKTDEPVFNPDAATLMDFSTTQLRGTTFFYVLPFSSTEALIEFTLFSKDVLENSEYEFALKNYIENDLGIADYEITEREAGIIPMTNHKFSKGKGNVINIGTAGGQTKGSSGYTFNFIQKHSEAIVECMEQRKHPFLASHYSKRHHFYDSVLLNILNNNSIPGDEIFTRLFKKNPAHKVLKFLDNETGIFEEIQIISTLPLLPFSRAAVLQLAP